ncbi:rho guanyl-nucleotide exchange factor [Cryptococcus wingfieldii CBS 7118]|uniref:Rho guanyl-nucleotide exchange factor n=1 Tax=Cryptococcus wingfieldii CBS 7118 TaxID=1295528 RepID=A0A1E3I1W1_9TREE|nr:rho guanyl-nucleotide exchange factor [Cryptococcus wingfieldii CBS 7118]ODN82498.1 rho guanyl-nucleotide exchange factor [Cryptococcus wingfieldii CBS 7118]
MAPFGPRQRHDPAPRQPPQQQPQNPNVRNEVFENIFGRPAVGHHQSHGPPPGQHAPPQPPPGGTYGYKPYPQQQQPSSYLLPAQPSYPPSFPAQGPPRQQPSPFAYRPQPTPAPQPLPPAEDPYDSVYGGVEGGYGNRSVSAGHPQALMPAGRRASLAPSTYSGTSSASAYSPNPNDIASPHQPTARLPSATFPTPKPRLPSGPNLQYPAGAMTPAQAYQTNVSSGYGAAQVQVPAPHGMSSGAPVAFPRRPSQPHYGSEASSSNASFASSSNPAALGRMPTSNSITSFHKPTTQSPPPPPNVERSTTPDYIGQMGHLSFENSPVKGGFQDDVANAGGREDERRDRHGSASGMARASMHRRMASDSSLSSSGHTTKPSRPVIAPLSTIDATRDEAIISTPTTPTGSVSDMYTMALLNSSRQSMESTLSLPLPTSDHPLPPGAAPGFEVRSTSFSGSTRSGEHTLKGRGSGFLHRHSHDHSNSFSISRHTSVPPATRQALSALPPIYPALLSAVAGAFKQIITLGDLVKDGITYKDSFEGRLAVAVIAEIIKTPDRNLALLLGRALDAQKFFHDVTYDHRLRDNPHELYQFKERLATPWLEGQENGGTESPKSEPGGLGRNGSGKSLNMGMGMGLGSGLRALRQARPNSDTLSMQTSGSATSLTSTPATSLAPSRSGTLGVDLNPEEDEDLPVGVFTLLTDCYSPTCSRDSLCYSINCPRRLEQMKRLNMKPEPGLTRKLSRESLHEVKETGTLWIHSVSQDILDSVDDREKKRQEAINEVIYTERDFVRDLEYLRDLWVKPLRTQEIVDLDRRDDFVRQVFWNVHDVLAVNQPLAERLTKRQQKEPVVSGVGDLFLERVPLFEPFVTYGAHQLFGKYEFEKEKGSNPDFQKFVDETERKPESRKLELNGYLTKPTTRLGRYPLLLEAVLKYTPDDHQDKKDLPEVIKMIKGFLGKVNVESGKSENIFELAQIEQKLVFRPNENIDLRLRDKNREIVHKGPLKRRGGSREEIADLTGFLFDHAFLLVKPKWVNKSEQYKVYRRPIPLELLVLVTPDESYNSSKLSHGRTRLITRHTTSSNNQAANSVAAPPRPESKHGFSLTIIHLGKKGYSMQLWVDTYIGRKKWLESIDKQQTSLREKSCVFVSESVADGSPSGLRKVNCASPYDQGNRMIFGTDDGVYFANLRDDKLKDPVKVISLIDVTQVDVIEEFQLLIVLHERCVTTFPLDSLDPSDPAAALKRGKRISSHTSFIKSGVCLGKTLVAIVKSSTLSSTIKVMEPVDVGQNKKKAQAGFMKRLNGREDALKLFKEFYIPTESSSVHFLKTKLCVGCTKGFEIVDLETLDMQGLLDPSDGSLDFVLKRDNVRPIAIYRIEEDFLLCYDEFAFYVNKNGWRARPKWAIVWEGVPTAFALHYPYVVAFEPTFIEVHHVETGHLVQIIPGNNIRCLFADTPPSRVNAPPPPNRMMYPGQAGGVYGRPPPHPGYPYPPNTAAYPHAPPAGRGYYPNPPLTSGARPRPPPQMGGYPVPHPHQQAPPGPPVNRFARSQVVFVSDESHVQFLKFPPPPTPGPQGQRGSLGAQSTTSLAGPRGSR